MTTALAMFVLNFHATLKFGNRWMQFEVYMKGVMQMTNGKMLTLTAGITTLGWAWS